MGAVEPTPAKLSRAMQIRSVSITALCPVTRVSAGGIESDISTVIMYPSRMDHWLRMGGKLAFLITATVYKSDSAAGFRKFRLPSGVSIVPLTIDDMVSLQPFPDARTKHC